MTPEERSRQAKYRRSILDFVSDSLRGLERAIGSGDRLKVDEYLEASGTELYSVAVTNRGTAPLSTQSGP